MTTFELEGTHPKDGDVVEGRLLVQADAVAENPTPMVVGRPAPLDTAATVVVADDE